MVECLDAKKERKTLVRKTDSESRRLKLRETQSFRSGVVLLQPQKEGLEEPFGSHSIGKERHHEISAYLWWHHQ